MTTLVAAALVFLGIHLFISGTKLRDAVIRAIGERPYLGLFSVASFAAIAWLVTSYNAAHASTDNRILYVPWIGVRQLAIPVMALAFLLAVPGLLLPNPTALKQESAAEKAETIRGVLRITRHPFLWGVVIWSVFHLSANGDEASVIFFGTFLLLALFGTFSIDAKRRRKMGEAWTGFASRTSNIPFGAVLAGSNSLKFGEIFDWRFLIAVVLFVAVLFFHARLFGAPSLPEGWLPH